MSAVGPASVGPGASDWPGPLALAASFAPDAQVVRRFGALPAWPDVDAYDALLASERLARVCPGLRFVLQRPRPRRRSAAVDAGPGYNESIVAGRVPTRARSWHDLFNGVIWSALPAAKLAIHRRQHELITARTAAAGDGPRGPVARSRVEDTLAMIDEGGFLLAVVPSRAEALTRLVEAGDQAAVDAWVDADEARAVVMGHALLEHLGRGQVARGFPVVVAVERPDDLGAVDDALAAMVPHVGEPGGRPGLSVRGRAGSMTRPD